MMNHKKTNKSKPRGRPQISTLKRLTKSVTVKFSKPDYEKLRHRSKNANRTLAEYIRDVEKAMSTDHLFVVTYDSEQLLIEVEKAVCTIENRQ